MRLAIISTFPPRKCGIGVYTRNLANSMSRLADTEIISFAGYDYADKRVRPMINGPLSYLKIANYIRKGRFDRVMIQYDYLFYNLFLFPLFLLLMRLYGLKTNLVIHTVAPYKDFVKRNLFRLYHTYLLLFTSKIFVHTQNAKDKLLGNTLIKKPVEIVPHPILIRNTEPRLHSPGAVKLLCFGFIVWDKGTDVAIEAFGGVKGVSLRIVGSVPVNAMKRQHEFLEKIKAMSSKYENVEFVNRFVSEEEKAAEYANCDFVIMPYRFIEQSGILAEAWSFQRIPVCSDIKSLAEDTASGRYGVLFKAEDADDLRERTLALAKDQEKQAELLANIKQVIADRDFDKLSTEFLKRMS